VPQPANPIRTAVYLSFLMVVIASTAMASTKYASGYASTAVIVTVQYLICMLMCLPRILRLGPSGLKTQRLPLHMFRGVVGVLGFYLFYASLQHIPMMDAMLLRQSAPLTVPLVMWVMSNERVAGRAWLPLIVGFIGIVVILRPASEGFSLWHLAGVISAFTLSLSMVATRKLASTEPPSRILFYNFFLSLICVAPFSIGGYAGLPWQVWLAMGYVGITIYFALILYTRAYSMAPASAIAPINYFAVVAAGFWGWLIWEQMPDTWSLVGSALVIFGGLLTVYQARQGEVSLSDV
jgi:drug/metabolite transporter (DMT)-like permease